MELIEILKIHAEKYPKMQPVDVVKLIYQNEMGGGHLIADKEKSLVRIREEYQTAKQSFRKEETEENIGNGWVRVYLSSLDGSEEDFQNLNEEFFRSAQSQTGSLTSLWKKLDCLMKHFDTIPFSFSQREMEEYLERYRKEGSPAVSHSDIYRKTYLPAYRIIRKGRRKQK